MKISDGSRFFAIPLCLDVDFCNHSRVRLFLKISCLTWFYVPAFLLLLEIKVRKILQQIHFLSIFQNNFSKCFFASGFLNPCAAFWVGFGPLLRPFWSVCEKLTSPPFGSFSASLNFLGAVSAPKTPTPERLE